MSVSSLSSKLQRPNSRGQTYHILDQFSLRLYYKKDIRLTTHHEKQLDIKTLMRNSKLLDLDMESEDPKKI